MMMLDIYGASWAFAYCMCVMIVTFGLFNLIMAIYIENTLEAARANEMKLSSYREKERLRVRQRVKDLIKKICTAHKCYDLKKDGGILRDSEIAQTDDADIDFDLQI